ncbi:MAG: M48 family metallopeptidase [Candidatus Saccharimonas sp.]
MNEQGANITEGQLAVKRAFSSSDLTILSITFVVFFLITCGYLIISAMIDLFKETGGAPSFFEITLALIGTFIAGVLFFAITLGLGMFVVRMQRQSVLGNSLQVEYSDFAWLRDWANTVSSDLEMPRVEIFVTQNPIINAYAFGFARPYCIVLHSGSIRYLTRDELKSVVVHEMAHIKYGHTNTLVYLTPFLGFPVLGTIFSWLAGFWQRRAELTADRLSLMYTKDSELVKRALIKVHVGPDVSDSMNEVARQWLQHTAERPMNHLAQTFSSHPFLVRRLSHLDKWKTVIEPTVAPTPEQTLPSN